MDDEIQLISDGDGLAIIGSPTAVERFLGSAGLPSQDLGLRRVGTTLGAAAAAAQAGAELAADSGRWVKLTRESARSLGTYDLMTGSHAGVARAVLTENGRIKELLEIVRPGSLLSNPAFLAGAAGLMAQLAMRQTMSEITDYLASIDQKVDDILRAQKDAVLADMIGAGVVLDDAMTVREAVGRVSEVTWSKVQSLPTVIARTQVYALRQLEALTEELEQQTAVGDLAGVSRDAERTVREWLAVLARCFQLQDAVAVLELDRVLEESAEEQERHRLGLREVRQKRMELIARTTERLLARVTAAVGTANANVLLNPIAAPAVVHSGNQVAATVSEFHARLGIGGGPQTFDARPWLDAAAETADAVLDAGAEGVDAALRFGAETLDWAGSVTDKLSTGLTEQLSGWFGDAEKPREKS